VLEAMMCGTPVIAFKRGSMPELITEGINGFLPLNISEAVLAIESLYKIDPKNCRAYAVKKFGLETMINNYIEAYRTVIQNRAINNKSLISFKDGE